MAELSVVALIATYNEADIIEQVIAALIEEGVAVYCLDDGSTDDTVARIQNFVGRGVIGIECLTESVSTASRDSFDWERILRRKEELAHHLTGDWFIHNDADEFRETPWTGVRLAEGIRRVDALGFNAIDFVSLDFWPTDDRFRPGADIRSTFTHWSPSAPYDRLQIRCWKRGGYRVDLVSSGGHEVQFPGRHVFPLRFLLRHYPIRGQAHGQRKVFTERRPRYREVERERGWHVQYDDTHPGTSFIRDSGHLHRYDPDAVRLSLTLRHRHVEELEQEAAAARRELEQCAARREALEQLAAANQGTLNRLGGELEAARQLLRQQDMVQIEMRAEADALIRQRDDARESAEALAQHVRATEARLDDLYSSRTWRWTGVPRAVYRLLTRRPR